MDNDATMRRRDFLRRTAYTAGLAGLTAALPVDVLLRQAAIAQAQTSGLPSPANMPLDHVVVVMMENRSFDHYFGWLAGADGSQAQTYADPDGTLHATRHASFMEAEHQGCGFADPGHGWDSGRAQLVNGFMGAGTGNDEFALTYYDEGELEFIHAGGQAFTVYDRFFCSLLGPTWPNRYYKWSAQSGGRKDNAPPVETAGNQWETIFDRAIGGGLSARYFPSDLPFSATWGPRGVPWTGSIPEYYARCASGTLPNISFVDPPFRDGGGADGLSADEHPHGDVRLGQAWMADAVHAFLQSPCWERGALFVVYDEWGGFFDHVTPPSVADDRASTDLYENFGQMGFRIPAVAFSPFAARGNVSHLQCGFESILKLITYRWQLGDLCARDAAASNIGLSFTNWDTPQLDVPDLPDPTHVVSRPCALGGGDVLEEQSARAHAGDLAALEDLADRFGFPVGDGKTSDLFREPDSVVKALG